MITSDDVLIGSVADEVGIDSWRLRMLADRGLCPQPQRLGRIRVFKRSDIPAIREAAHLAGYIRSERVQAIADAAVLAS